MIYAVPTPRHPLTPYADLESRFARTPVNPEPSLAAVFVADDDDRCELTLSIDADGLAVATLYARDLEMVGSAPIVVHRPSDDVVTAVAAVDAIGFDMTCDSLVDGTLSLASSWALTTSSSGRHELEVAGVAITSGLAGRPAMRFTAIASHSFNAARAPFTDWDMPPTLRLV